MSTDAAAAGVLTSEESHGLPHRAIGAAFDFVRAVAGDPTISDDVPNGATLILVPANDSDLAAAGIEQGVAAVRRGENAYFLHVAPASKAESVWAEAKELDREYRSIQEKTLAGELTVDESFKELDALFDRISLAAMRMSSRRSRVMAATWRAQSGIEPSPVLAAIQTLADEMGDALDNGEMSFSLAASYVDRIMPLLKDFRRELGEP